MLLVVDFSELSMEFDRTDIHLDSNTDFTVGKLINKLCDGIEEIARTKIPNKSMLDLFNSRHTRVEATQKVKDLSLNDWDTVFIKRRVGL